MNLKDITTSIKSKIENKQRADQNKTLKANDISLIPEFEKLLKIDDSVLTGMTDSMKTEGFKPGHEVHIWLHDGKYILIDGHTRKHVWCDILGNTAIPCIIHHFVTLEEAKQFALKEQTNRRNLSGEALLEAVSNFDFSKGKGNIGIEKGKTSEIIGKHLGISSKTVEKARVVLKEATEEQKEAIRKEELSVNQVYNQLRSTNDTPQTETPKQNKQKQLTDPSINKKLSPKEIAFKDGVLYAISKVADGTTPKDLYSRIQKDFNLSDISKEINAIDFETLFAMGNA